MKHIKQLSWAVGIALFAVSASQSQQARVSAGSCNVVEQALAAYHVLKPGMTRAEVERDFRLEGGIYSRRLVRYTYKESIYIKLEVEYLHLIRTSQRVYALLATLSRPSQS